MCKIIDLMHSIYLVSMEEVKKAQDKDDSVVAKAAQFAEANNIDAATLALYREVFDIVDFAVRKMTKHKYSQLATV